METNNSESNTLEVSPLLLESIQKAGLHSYKGDVPDKALKVIELELARDAIDFWHSLFAIFGLSPSEQPYNSLPSIEDHRYLFETLLVHLASPDTYQSLNSDKDRLLTGLRSVRDKQCELSDLEDEYMKYFKGISKNVAELETVFTFNPACRSLKQKIEGIKIKDRSKSSWKGVREDVSQDIAHLEEITKICLGNRLIKSTGIKIRFAEKFFKENGYADKEDKIKLEFIKAMSTRYSYLSTKENFSNINQENSIYRANVLTANLFVKSGDQYYSLSIHYNQDPIISPLSLQDEVQKLEKAMKDRFGALQDTKYILDTYSSLEFTHSEKGLIASLSNEENLKELTQELKKRIRQGKKELSDPIKVGEIGIQIFSVREYCYWCESFLSDDFSQQYQTIKQLLEEDGDVVVEGKPFIKKYCSYSFGYNAVRSQSNQENKGKFEIDISPKTYFNNIFLKDSSNNYHNCSSNPRTYFLNDPKNKSQDEIVNQKKIIIESAKHFKKFKAP